MIAGLGIARLSPAALTPSNRLRADELRKNCAALIDEAQGVAQDQDGEVKRLAALAATAFEEGCMWLTKAYSRAKP